MEFYKLIYTFNIYFKKKEVEFYYLISKDIFILSSAVIFITQ